MLISSNAVNCVPRCKQKQGRDWDDGVFGVSYFSWMTGSIKGKLTARNVINKEYLWNKIYFPSKLSDRFTWKWKISCHSKASVFSRWPSTTWRASSPGNVGRGEWNRLLRANRGKRAVPSPNLLQARRRWSAPAAEQFQTKCLQARMWKNYWGRQAARRVEVTCLQYRQAER